MSSKIEEYLALSKRPDATACADYDVWNNRMNRYVCRDSKGIALLDESSGYPQLHYVFDVCNTGTSTLSVSTTSSSSTKVRNLRFIMPMQSRTPFRNRRSRYRGGSGTHKTTV